MGRVYAESGIGVLTSVPTSGGGCASEHTVSASCEFLESVESASRTSLETECTARRASGVMISHNAEAFEDLNVV